MNTVSTAAPERYVFGPYEILDTLGRGGMGVVYRAHDRTLKREVALKILRDDLRGEERVLARFRREAETFAKLDHPNIVHIHSVGAIEQIPYIAMEYISGETMASRMRREGPLPWQEALRIGAEVAKALDCAHRAQVVHRDVKPGNILLSEDGGVHVTDFGIAKVLNAETQLTVDGSRLGTPQYMCPERCKNKAVTPVSDLYSLGVLLFQAITGKLPYCARSSVELVECIISQPPLRASSLVADLPESVDRLLAWLLEKKPTERPVTAGLLAEAIERVLAGKPLDAEAEEREQALKDYRQELPRQQAQRKAIKEEVKPVPRAKTRRRRPLPRKLRLILTGALGVVALGMASALAAYAAMRPAPQLEHLSAQQALSRWTPPPALISFSQEGPGLRLGSINAGKFENIRLFPGAAAGRFVVELTGPGGRLGCAAFDAASGESASLLAPVEPSTDLLGIAPVAADDQGETLLVDGDGGTRLAHGDEGFANGAMFSNASAMTLPYLTRRGWECAIALTRAGHHAWQLEAYSTAGYAGEGPLTAPGSPIVSVAAAMDGGRFAFLREGSNSSLELWTGNRGGEAELVEEGALSLTQRAWNAAATMVAYTREGTEPQVAVASPQNPEAATTWPGAEAQWAPGLELVVYRGADALQREQLFAMDPARPLAPMQLTQLDTGVAPHFAIEPLGRWVAAPLKGGARQVIVVDLTGLMNR